MHANVLSDRDTRRLDTDRLMTAIRRLGDPAAHPSVPFTPRPFTDRAYYAPCLEQRPPRIEYKRCTRCGIEQEVREFRASQSATRTGLQSWCRTCEREYQRNKRQERAA